MLDTFLSVFFRTFFDCHVSLGTCADREKITFKLNFQIMNEFHKSNKSIGSLYKLKLYNHYWLYSVFGNFYQNCYENILDISEVSIVSWWFRHICTHHKFYSSSIIQMNRNLDVEYCKIACWCEVFSVATYESCPYSDALWC